MDFFTEQDQARRSSKVLIILFSLSVLVLIVLTNILVAVTLWLFDEQVAGNYQAYQQAVETLNYQRTSSLFNYLSWQRFALISLVVSSVIGCAIIYKWAQLSGGGKRVAEQLGGHRINPNTDNNHEKRILNVVEEMAIASGMPVPAVYLLADELGINAFAAGSTPADAVIGVTQGCIDQFNREQLQGVIAHEFSHILNGDMRLNIRLIALLHGILFVGLIGEMILRGSSNRSYSHSRRRSGDNRLALLGLAFLVIGWLGQFFGNWIKSAVSRQREFLADASAVQFTRNPKGIADALKIIGGYNPNARLQASRASEMSHLFFGQAVSKINRLFASHPPLDKRISRIEPDWNGQFIFRDPQPLQADADQQNTNQQDKSLDATFATIATAAAATQAFDAANNLGDIRGSIDAIPAAIHSQIHEPFGAIAVLYGLLLSENTAIQQKQLEYIQLSNITGLSIQTIQLQPDISALDQPQRLPLIELALPALKCMSAQQYKTFCKTLLLLIRADKKFELFEWCLYQLVRHYLDPEFNKVKTTQPIYKEASSVSSEFQLVLSLLAHYGSDDVSECERAFNRGANTTGLYTLTLLAKENCTLDAFVTAVNKLANCYPLLKPRLLKGLADCAKHDGAISAVEKEMISAISAVMDCPVPILSI